MSSVPLPEPVDDVRVTWRGETEFLRAEDDYYTANQMHAHAAAVSAAECAPLIEEIEALRQDGSKLTAERDALRDAVAKNVTDATMLTGLTTGGDGLTVGLQGGAASLLAEMLAEQYKGSGAVNYLQLSFESRVTLPGEAFIVTVQRVAGKTPHQLRAEAEAERDALRQYLEAAQRRAESLRERVAVLEQALRGVLPWVVTQVVACNGLKCREDVCMSCNSDAEDNAQLACNAYGAADAALKRED
jgi:hypothetical protein